MMGDFTLGRWGFETDQQAADYYGVSLKTFNRYRASERAPLAVCKLQRLLANDLSALHVDWAGWTMGRDGLLYDEHNNGYTPGQVRASFYQMQIAREHQRKIARERAERVEQETIKPGNVLPFITR